MIADPLTLENPLREAIAEKDRPQRTDPKENYLHSANERVVDQSYPNYLGSTYEEPFRGKRIREMLEAHDKVSPEDMIAIQSDDLNPLAQAILPLMLKDFDIGVLNETQKTVVKRMMNWDYRMRAESFEGSVFQTWYKFLKHKIFTQELPEAKKFGPRDVRIVEILDHVESNPNDPDRRFLKEPTKAIAESFTEAWDELSKRSTVPSEWLWRDTVDTHIPHVAQIPGFGSERLDFDGSQYSVRGNAGTHGAVYRFVVALGEWPNAWIQIPGGNDGDPLSKNFENYVNDWAAGKMRKVEFYKSLDEAKNANAKLIQFTTEKK